MFRRAFSRSPDDTELARWTTMAQELAEPGGIMSSVDVWKQLAHTMFNAKEFIYVR
jgi:hypothetical protein